MIIKNPIKEETIDMKIERASTTRTKSKPGKRDFLIISSLLPKANGMSIIGRTVVASPSRTDHTDRALFDIKEATGMVSEPITGTKTVNNTIFSIVIIKSDYANYQKELKFIKIKYECQENVLSCWVICVL